MEGQEDQENLVLSQPGQRLRRGASSRPTSRAALYSRNSSADTRPPSAKGSYGAIYERKKQHLQQGGHMQQQDGTQQQQQEEDVQQQNAQQQDDSSCKGPVWDQELDRAEKELHQELLQYEVRLQQVRQLAAQQRKAVPGDGRQSSVVKRLVAATGRGCGALLLPEEGAKVPSTGGGGCWTTRFHRLLVMESSCVLKLNPPALHQDVCVRMEFAHARVVPAIVRLEHAPGPVAKFVMLGEIQLQEKSLRQLRHMFRLGQHQQVQRVLRITCMGWLARDHSGMHRVSSLLVTGEPANSHPLRQSTWETAEAATAEAEVAWAANVAAGNSVSASWAAPGLAPQQSFRAPSSRRMAVGSAAGRLWPLSSSLCLPLAVACPPTLGPRLAEQQIIASQPIEQQCTATQPTEEQQELASAAEHGVPVCSDNNEKNEEAAGSGKEAAAGEDYDEQAAAAMPKVAALTQPADHPPCSSDQAAAGPLPSTQAVTNAAAELGGTSALLKSQQVQVSTAAFTASCCSPTPALTPAEEAQTPAPASLPLPPHPPLPKTAGPASPPPPLPGEQRAAPPVPSPPTGKVAACAEANAGQERSAPVGRDGEGRSPSKPMVKLFWEKLPPNQMEATVWSNLEGLATSVDYEALKEGFAPKQAAKAINCSSPTPKRVVLLPVKRCNNVGVFLRKLNLAPRQAKEAILKLLGEDHPRGTKNLTDDQIEGLLPCLPTEEEMRVLRAHKGPAEELGEVEQFMLEVMDIPALEPSLRALRFAAQFEERADLLHRSGSLLKKACKEIKDCALLAEVLKRALLVGNFLNADLAAQRGACGFQIDSLLKLKDVKSTSSSSSTLLHFLARELTRTRRGASISEVSGSAPAGGVSLKACLPSCKDAAKLSLGELHAELGELKAGLQQVVGVVEHLMGSKGSTFAEGLAGFHKGARRQMDELELHILEAEAAFRHLSTFLNGQRAIMQEPAAVFGVLSTFSDELDAAHDDNAKADVAAKKASQQQQQQAGERASSLVALMYREGKAESPMRQKDRVLATIRLYSKLKSEQGKALLTDKGAAARVRELGIQRRHSMAFERMRARTPSPSPSLGQDAVARLKARSSRKRHTAAVEYMRACTPSPASRKTGGSSADGAGITAPAGQGQAAQFSCPEGSRLFAVETGAGGASQLTEKSANFSAESEGKPTATASSLMLHTMALGSETPPDQLLLGAHPSSQRSLQLSPMSTPLSAMGRRNSSESLGRQPLWQTGSMAGVAPAAPVSFESARISHAYATPAALDSTGPTNSAQGPPLVLAPVPEQQACPAAVPRPVDILQPLPSTTPDAFAELATSALNESLTWIRQSRATAAAGAGSAGLGEQQSTWSGLLSPLDSFALPHIIFQQQPAVVAVAEGSGVTRPPLRLARSASCSEPLANLAAGAPESWQAKHKSYSLPSSPRRASRDCSSAAADAAAVGALHASLDVDRLVSMLKAPRCSQPSIEQGCHQPSQQQQQEWGQAVQATPACSMDLLLRHVPTPARCHHGWEQDKLAEEGGCDDMEDEWEEGLREQEGQREYRLQDCTDGTLTAGQSCYDIEVQNAMAAVIASAGGSPTGPLGAGLRESMPPEFDDRASVRASMGASWAYLRLSGAQPVMPQPLGEGARTSTTFLPARFAAAAAQLQRQQSEARPPQVQHASSSVQSIQEYSNTQAHNGLVPRQPSRVRGLFRPLTALLGSGSRGRSAGYE